MKIPFYLVVGSGKTVRVNKSAPKLDWNEVSIYMVLEVPDKIFEKPF